MSQKQAIQAGSTGAPFGSLQEFLPHYKQYLAKHFKDVKEGEDMLELGAKTTLMQDLEKFALNPLETLFDAHTSMGNAIQQAAAQFLFIFFKTAQENNIVKKVFIIPADRKALSYGIILNEDTFKNRESILDFLNLYSTFNFAEKVPVYFQFIPEKLASAFGDVTYII